MCFSYFQNGSIGPTFVMRKQFLTFPRGNAWTFQKNIYIGKRNARPGTGLLRKEKKKYNVHDSQRLHLMCALCNGTAKMMYCDVDRLPPGTARWVIARCYPNIGARAESHRVGVSVNNPPLDVIMLPFGGKKKKKKWSMHRTKYKLAGFDVTCDRKSWRKHMQTWPL